MDMYSKKPEHGLKPNSSSRRALSTSWTWEGSVFSENLNSNLPPWFNPVARTKNQQKAKNTTPYWITLLNYEKAVVV
jgi:hypothetical protein